MAKYQFRLDTLRKIRAVHRDGQRAALADAYRAEEILMERRAALASEQNALRESQRVAMSSRYLDVNRLIEAQRYEMVLKVDEQHLADQAGRLAAEIDRRRLALVEANRAVRVLDLLDQRQRHEHRRQQLRSEVKELDEIAMTKRQMV